MVGREGKKVKTALMLGKKYWLGLASSLRRWGGGVMMEKYEGSDGEGKLSRPLSSPARRTI